MAEKEDKSAVGYKRGGDNCGVCKFIIEVAEGRPCFCQKVKGEVTEDMWCRRFKRETKTLAETGSR